MAGNLGSVPVVDRSGRRDAGLQNWDGVIGVKGHASFGDGNKWFVTKARAGLRPGAKSGVAWDQARTARGHRLADSDGSAGLAMRR